MAKQNKNPKQNKTTKPKKPQLYTDDVTIFINPSNSLIQQL